MKNTIYTVKNGNGIAKLSKFEKSIYDFLTSGIEWEVGTSLSEKELKKQFAKWNDEKMTVSASSLVNESMCKKIAKYHAFKVQSGELSSKVIFQVRVNKAHGNFSLDILDACNLFDEYSEKELKEKAITKINPLEFISKYIEKHSSEIETIDGKNESITAIIDFLETLKD